MPNTIPTLWARVDQQSDGCWRWTGTTTTKGYGQVGWQGVRHQAHRLFYTLLIGPIADGMTLDHLCRNRWCVNPQHLEPVPNRANVMRGLVPSANRTRCTADKHDISTLASIYVDCYGYKRCRECRRESKRAYAQRKRAAA